MVLILKPLEVGYNGFKLLDMIVIKLSFAGHRDTWAFLERRIKDAVDCRKTVQEVTISADIPTMCISRGDLL